MEHQRDFALVSALQQQFQAISSYQEKVHFFDLHWGLLPFTPPPFDPELRWLVAQNSAFDLFNLFLLEQDRRKNAYIKTVCDAGHSFTFSINPLSKNQRIALNTFIATKFLNTFTAWEKQDRKSATGTQAPGVWEEKLRHANRTMAVLREKAAKNDHQLHTKFLQVFFKGFSDKILNEAFISKRKRFVELLLYSQGLLYAQYMSLLEKRIEQSKSQPVAAQPLLSKKLQVMEKMGVFSFLKTELRRENRNKKQLIKEIYFLLSGQWCLPTKDENSLIENFLFTEQNSSDNRK